MLHCKFWRRDILMRDDTKLIHSGYVTNPATHAVATPSIIRWPTSLTVLGTAGTCLTWSSQGIFLRGLWTRLTMCWLIWSRRLRWP